MNKTTGCEKWGNCPAVEEQWNMWRIELFKFSLVIINKLLTEKKKKAAGGEGGNQFPTSLQDDSFAPFYLVSEVHA